MSNYGLGFIVLFLLMGALYVWSIFWAYGDAENRGKSGCPSPSGRISFLAAWPSGVARFSTA